MTLMSLIPHGSRPGIPGVVYGAAFMSGINPIASLADSLGEIVTRTPMEMDSIKSSRRSGPWVLYTGTTWDGGTPFHKEFMGLLFKSYKKTCCSYIKHNNENRSQLCTCHDSSAVVTWANLWPGLIFRIKPRVKRTFTRFELWAQKIYVKWVSDHWSSCGQVQCIRIGDFIVLHQTFNARLSSSHKMFI